MTPVPRNNKWITRAVLAVAVAGVAASALAATSLMRTGPRFVSWEGIGPDKWGSAWLLRRHVSPRANVSFVPTGTPLDPEQAFDVPGYARARDATQTAFEKIRREYAVDDAQVRQVSELLGQVELSGWQVRAFSDAAVFETAYRDLQYRFGREQVPQGCYMALFDRLAVSLKTHAGQLATLGSEALAPADACADNVVAGARPKLVPELAVHDVLARMAAGDRVVFVDTRERDEFDAGHIPGAVHLRLRDVGKRDVPALADADLVVPYCVKDFRGFEVARALSKRGIENVALMQPFGISGWKQLGLPVAFSRDDHAASAALERCASDLDACLPPA